MRCACCTASQIARDMGSADSAALVAWTIDIIVTYGRDLVIATLCDVHRSLVQISFSEGERIRGETMS